MDETNATDGVTESTARMPEWSRYAGQSVDLSSRRSLRFADPAMADRLPDTQTSEVMVDNFYHGGKFWRAQVPLNGVTEVRGQAFNFSAVRTRQRGDKCEVVRDRHGRPRHRIPMLNHVQVRFRTSAADPVLLFAPDASPPSDPATRVNDFVYSLEVLGPAQVAFNLRDGLQGNLLAAHRFLSTEEMVFERLVVENQYVTETPPLRVSASERRDFLSYAMLKSHRAAHQEPYYLCRMCGTNNCTSSPFSIVDQIVEYNWRHRLGAMLYRLPLNPRLYLRVRGLDPAPSQRILVRDEFVDYIDNPSTQARKREHVRRRRELKRQIEKNGIQSGSFAD